MFYENIKLYDILIDKHFDRKDLSEHGIWIYLNK